MSYHLASSRLFDALFPSAWGRLRGRAPPAPGCHRDPDPGPHPRPEDNPLGPRHHRHGVVLLEPRPAECDAGGEGCVEPGTWTHQYGPAVCVPPPEEHILQLRNGTAGPAVARQVRGVRLDRPPAVSPEELTYLLIDIHGGALGDTLAFLHNVIKVPRGNIFFLCMWTPYCRFVQRKWTAAGRSPDVVTGVHYMAYDWGYPGAVSYALDAATMLPLLHFANLSSATGFRWPVDDFVARAHAWAAARAPGSGPIVDVVICNVGAELCLALEPLVGHVIVRSTHRFDHASCGAGSNWLQAAGPERWHTGFQTGRMIQRLAESPHHSVAAAQPYDAAYHRHFLGVSSWLWPIAAPDAVAEYHPLSFLRHKVLVVPNWPADPQNNWKVYLRQLNASLVERGMELNTPSGYYGRFTHERLMQHSVAVSVPYSIGSQLWFELYRMGMPMFAPTAHFMAQLHRRHGIVFHRCCELRPHCPRPCYTAADFGQSNSTQQLPSLIGDGKTEMQLPPHGSQNLAAARTWLGLLEQYHLPHIEYFSDWEELAQRLSETSAAALRVRSRRQRAAALVLEQRAAERVRGKLEDLAAAGPAPLHGEYSGRTPVHLPRCARVATHRTNFHEWGQTYGTPDQGL
eukprot:TRINITY_DN17779_c0_g1_i1.p1 TRINITY_DN17779_c0_g1~~TRINITY_DN17779_c0_g1_i1.p1  ORF type:complete len:705 (+),score=151.50 TRINITY_DN17779_c0_g1_i1:236-2116(+)